MLCRFSLESLSRHSALSASPSWCPGSDSARGLPSVHWPEGSVRAEDLSLCGAGRGQKGPPCARRRGTLPRPAQEHTGGFVSSGTLRSKPLGPACGELGSCDRPPCQNQPPTLKQTRVGPLPLAPPRAQGPRLQSACSGWHEGRPFALAPRLTTLLSVMCRWGSYLMSRGLCPLESVNPPHSVPNMSSGSAVPGTQKHTIEVGRGASSSHKLVEAGAGPLSKNSALAIFQCMALENQSPKQHRVPTGRGKVSDPLILARPTGWLQSPSLIPGVPGDP